MDEKIRHITVSNYDTWSHVKTTANNTITLVQDVNNARQWGVSHVNNYQGVMNSNLIRGWTISSTADVRGTHNSMARMSSVRCNNVTTLTPNVN